MANVQQSDTPIISESILRDILNTVKDDIEANPGRVILNLIVSSDNTSVESRLDPRPNQPELIDAALARARAEGGKPLDSGELQFATEIKRLWSGYDHEEMIVCIITAGHTAQIIVCPKPWLDKEKLHEHCTCGIRRGTAHDDYHKSGA